MLVKQRRLLEAYELSFAVAEGGAARIPMLLPCLARRCSIAGNFKEARLMFVNAIRLNKREGLAWAGLGMLDFYENRVTESMDRLNEAVFHSPDEPDYWFALAQVRHGPKDLRKRPTHIIRFLLISRNTDDERRARIRGLINFLQISRREKSLYETVGEQQTSVSFKLVGNRPIIQVKANDREEPLNFVLDTGSGISVISDKTAKKLRIEPITRGGLCQGDRR